MEARKITDVYDAKCCVAQNRSNLTVPSFCSSENYPLLSYELKRSQCPFD